MQVDRAWKWKRAVFTVPNSITHDRVVFDADKYRNYFGQGLEREGWTVLGMSPPFLAKDQDVGCDPDRRKYHILARCTKSDLVTIKYDVPDEHIAGFQKLGWKPT